jgi:hypothetical protein
LTILDNFLRAAPETGMRTRRTVLVTEEETTMRRTRTSRSDPSDVQNGMNTLKLGGATTLAAIALIVLAFGACGGGNGGHAESELPAECDVYVSAYRACTTRSGAPSTVVAERVTSLRASLQKQAARGEAALTEVRAQCRAAIQAVEESCR